MSRLIDADVLSDQMYHEAFETDTEMQRWDGGCWIRYKMFENALCNAPTIEERKTGRWDCSDDMYETAICSACGWDTTDPWSHIRHWFNYCPNCGADMRGEKDEL